MFQSRRQTTFGNINIGNLSAPPGLDDMRCLLEQATRYRTRFVEIAWLVPQSGANFQLTAKILPTQPDPAWMLYRNSNGNSELVWGHSSSDLTLMHNLVILECERSMMAGNSEGISSNALDAMMENNANSGSVARGASDSNQKLNPATGSMRAAPSSTGYQQPAAHQQQQSQQQQSQQQQQQQSPFSGSDPASLWLRNLNQSPDAYGSNKEDPINADANSTTESGDSLGSSPSFRYSVPTTVPTVHSYSAVEVGERLLDGSLSNITVPNVLRHIHENRLTGRLALQSSFGAAEVFFTNGELKHAATLDNKGENALYDISTWGDGEFHFSSEDQTSQTTLAYEPSVLISNCQRMLDYHTFLTSSGLNSASYLDRNNPLSRGDFETKLNKQGQAGDLHQAWRFYETINGNLTLSEVLRSCPLTRTEWMPALYNLVRLKLVILSDRPMTYQPGAFLEPAVIDQGIIENFLSAATYPADGLMSKGLFLWLLQQEFYRFERSGARFALVVFNVSITNMLDSVLTPLSKESFAEATRRILQAKRKLDSVGHFDNEYAMLLPETDSAGAAVFANRILQLWKKPILSEELESSSTALVTSFGIASVPDDVRDLGALISAARIAKKKSQMMGASVVLYAH